MEESNYTVSILANINLLVGKNLRQSIKRDIDSKEHIVLTSALLLRKITVYEVLFIMGLKISMKRFVESFLEQLYNDGYLEIESEFDKVALKRNFDQIFNEIYENKGYENRPAVEDVIPTNNILHFSSKEIKEEIDKILFESTFLYQYSLTKEGEEALKNGKILTYSEEATINCAIINLNFKKNDTNQSNSENASSIIIEDNIIFAIMINMNYFPYSKQFHLLNKLQYPLISALLKDNKNMIVDPSFSLQSIELSKNTEFVEQELKNVSIDFILDKVGRIVNIIVKNKELENWNIDSILKQTTDYFIVKPFFSSEIARYLKDLLDKEFQEVPYTNESNGIRLTVKNKDNLQFIKAKYHKLYDDFDKYHDILIKENQYNLILKVRAQMDIDLKEKDLLSTFFADLLHNSISKEKPYISSEEITKWTTELINRMRALYPHEEFQTESLISEIKQNLQGLGILIVDDLIFDYYQKKIHNTNLRGSDLIIQKNQDLYRVYLVIDSRSLMEADGESNILFNKETISYPVQENIFFKVQFFLLPESSFESQISLLAKKLSVQLKNILLVSLKDFTNFIRAIFSEWQESGKILGLSHDFSRFNLDLEKESNSSILTQIYQEMAKFNVQPYVVEWKLEDIQQELFFNIPTELNIFENVHISEKNYNEKHFSISFSITEENLNKILFMNDSLKKQLDSKVYRAILEHTTEFKTKIDDTINFDIKLIRVISESRSDQKSQTATIPNQIFFNLFFTLYVADFNNSFLYSLQNRFNKFYEQYLKNVPRSPEVLTPVFTDEEIRSGLLQNCIKYKIELNENKILNSLEEQLNKNLQIANLYIIENALPQILYQIPKNEFFDLYKKHKNEIFLPYNIKLKDRDIDSEYTVFFLPLLQKENMDLKAYFGNYLIHFFNWKKDNEKIPELLFQIEFFEHLEKILMELHDRYKLFDQGNIWRPKSVLKLFTSANFEKLKNLGLQIHIIDEKMKAKLIHKPFMQKYSWNNYQRIEVNPVTKAVYYKFTKSELLSLKGLDDYQFLIQTHELSFKINKQEIKMMWYFKPLDKTGLIEFSYLQYFFTNNKTFDKENFGPFNPPFRRFLFSKSKELGIELTKQEMSDRIIKECLAKLKKNFLAENSNPKKYKPLEEK